MLKTGLPHNAWQMGFNKPERIVEISADADELVALSVEGGFYRYCFDKTIAHKSRVWLDRQGWPHEEQLYLDTLGENMELSECSLRIGEDFITPICRVVRTKPDMSMEFIFLPDVDRILLDNFLEALPLQELKARQET
jgi:hypothetical protein